MKRKRISKEVAAPKRKRLKRTIEVPDRPAPTLMKIGPKSEFKPWEIKKLRAAGTPIDRVYDTAWIAMFSGPGYVDYASCAMYKGAQSVVSMFSLRYPRMKVLWLKGGRDVTTDNAIRGGKATDSKRTSTAKQQIQRRLQQRKQRLADTASSKPKRKRPKS